MRLIQSVLPPAEIPTWSSRIDVAYAKLEAARQHGGMAAVADFIAPGERFVPTASSLTIGAVFPGVEIRKLFGLLTAKDVLARARKELGNRIVCDLDHAWIRRQYAPGRYQPLHAPHGWHQDGALGFDFMRRQTGGFPADAMLRMATCWIALGRCGFDAPGLELCSENLDALLPPAELVDAHVRARFAPDRFWRPVMEPGDGLVFGGNILHRTHVTTAMTNNRTSIELRFFPAEAIPERLTGDRFVELD